MGNQTKGSTLSGVERSFKIVKYLKETGSTTVTELASVMDFPKSTAYIHLKTLYEAGYVHKENHQYRLSLRFLEHGAAVQRQFAVYEVSEPEINDLARKTSEVANLGVKEDDQRVLLYINEGGDAIYDNALTGEFTNMHWTSLGKAMLAYISRDQVSEIIDERGLPAATEYTITKREEFYDELDKIYNRGYAVEDEEHRENIRAVAVPILQDGQALAAISVSGPKTRFSDERIESELLELLRDKANIIELKLEHYYK